MTLVRLNSGRELAAMEIDRLNHMFEDLYANGRAWAPAVDIYETADREYVIKADLPDMKREEINVTFENNVLTLTGERKPEFDADNGKLHRSERAHGRFTRSFTLPSTVDGNRVSAAYKDGVLTVRLPQREEAKPRQIQVQA
jgi:HSP20 family protein